MKMTTVESRRPAVGEGADQLMQAVVDGEHVQGLEAAASRNVAIWLGVSRGFWRTNSGLVDTSASSTLGGFGGT